jgi:hypothetical protein
MMSSALHFSHHSSATLDVQNNASEPDRAASAKTRSDVVATSPIFLSASEHDEFDATGSWK